jgi:hypothetical protein
MRVASVCALCCSSDELPAGDRMLRRRPRELLFVEEGRRQRLHLRVWRTGMGGGAAEEAGGARGSNVIQSWSSSRVVLGCHTARRALLPRQPGAELPGGAAGTGMVRRRAATGDGGRKGRRGGARRQSG